MQRGEWPVGDVAVREERKGEARQPVGVGEEKT